MAQLMPLPLTVSCFSKIQIGFTCLAPAHSGSTGKWAIKSVYVCVSVVIICQMGAWILQEKEQLWVDISWPIVKYMEYVV